MSFYKKKSFWLNYLRCIWFTLRIGLMGSYLITLGLLTATMIKHEQLFPNDYESLYFLFSVSTTLGGIVGLAAGIILGFLFSLRAEKKTKNLQTILKQSFWNVFLMGTISFAAVLIAFNAIGHYALLGTTQVLAAIAVGYALALVVFIRIWRRN